MNTTIKKVIIISSVTALLSLISIYIAFIIRARQVGLGQGDVGEE